MIKIAILRVMTVALKIIYLPFMMLTVKRKVTFLSRQSNEPSRDIRMLAGCIAEKHRDVRIVILTKMIGSSIVDKAGYVLHMIQQMYHIATSKVVILDGYCIVACITGHKKDTAVIQMWHALGAVKKFGYQTLGKSAGADEKIARVMHMHENYDYVLSPGGETDRYFQEGFHIREDKLIHLALPRVDYIVSDDAATVERIKQHYGIDNRNKVVLYAPTFRRGGNVPIEELIKAFDFSNRILVIKLHPLDQDKINNNSAVCGQMKNLIIDNTFDSYEWLQVCDIVVTDYSALAIEASLKNKPLYFYVYDFEDYIQKVGLNIDIRNDMGDFVVFDAEKLTEKMNGSYDYRQLERFKRKYISASVENCTEKIAGFILSRIKEK